MKSFLRASTFLLGVSLFAACGAVEDSEPEPILDEVRAKVCYPQYPCSCACDPDFSCQTWSPQVTCPDGSTRDASWAPECNSYCIPMNACDPVNLLC